MKNGLGLTEDVVAINVREGAKRANEGVAALRRRREGLDIRWDRERVREEPFQ
jgi:hypothetical protein